jgi:hypothetical protein
LNKNKGEKMPKITFEVPSDIEKIISRHSEVDWNKIIADALWSYAKKMRLLDSITSKSKLTEEDVEVLDHEIKATLLKKYQSA